ncbi:GDSL-type esterase/lipase family protein [Bradyrhizobium sp. Ai1a-2]|uniref:GDSL-type esterase/lipase family protein n=1 Tax=Bradyrhizobium sp. Ai1a-2 TaxID=196490 RepID=UPI000A04B64B|nr:GDSL-type esterase/lipase family protein [Bradyrhizobium sp. Ai1a-2]
MERRAFLKTFGIGAAGLGTALWAGSHNTMRGGCYLQLGTSISAGTGSTHGGATPSLIGERLGMFAVNGAFPGSCAGQHKVSALNPVSLYAIADAISSDDWSAQQRTGEPVHDSSLGNLQAMRFSRVTHIALEYGANDFRYDRPIGADDDVGSETFKGALNCSIRLLRKSCPTARIFLITPWWLPTQDDRDSDVYPNRLGCFLRDYIAAMMHVADINRVPCLDLFNSGGVSKTNYRALTHDGVHPNNWGVLLRAVQISSFISTSL